MAIQSTNRQPEFSVHRSQENCYFDLQADPWQTDSAMTRGVLICISLHSIVSSYSQSYTSYFTGIQQMLPRKRNCFGPDGWCVENDNAMRWFLGHSGGGDIVVIRTSGSDG